VYRSFLSWRYLISRPTNLIGIVGILVAVGALILILSIMTGFLEESRRTVRGTLSDLILNPYQGERTRGGPETPPTVGRLPGPILAVLAEDARVAAACPQLVWGGIITQKERGQRYERLLADANASGSGMIVVQLVGVDVQGFERLSELCERVALAQVGGVLALRRYDDELGASAFLRSLVGDPGAGRHWTSAPVNPLFPFAPPPQNRPGRPRAGILVGDQLFNELGLDAGDVLEVGTIVRDPADGEWRQSNLSFAVTGTFRTRDNETDLRRMYLDRRVLADFLGHTREYTQILVRLADYERDARAVEAELRERLGERGLIAGIEEGAYEVRTWEQFRGNLLGAIENERVLMGIMLSLVLVVAGFTIFAILSMMVTEKRRDIGILTALGGTPRGVLQLFLMIAFWDALLGGLLGGALGTWAAIEIDPIERWLSSTFGVQIFDRKVYLFDHIPSVVQPLWVGAIVVGAFLCALLFAAIPAWRAARLDPLEALRYE